MATTASPVNIYFTDPSQPESSENESATQASSIHAQFALRERYDFVWANDAERTAQAGMVEGSRGYQINTKTEYRFDNGVWRLAIEYAEFSTTKTIANAAGAGAGVFALDAARSTSSTVAAPGTDGIITITNPGLYMISATTSFPAGVTNSGDSSLNIASGSTTYGRTVVAAGQTYIFASAPAVFVTVPNTQIYIEIYQSSGASRSMVTRLSLTRIG